MHSNKQPIEPEKILNGILSLTSLTPLTKNEGMRVIAIVISNKILFIPNKKVVTPNRYQLDQMNKSVNGGDYEQ